MARPRLLLLTLPASAAVIGAAWLLASRPSLPVSSSANLFVTPRHPVTEPMKERAAAQQGDRAPDFTLTSSEGQRVSLAGLLQKGPAVIVMTKDGCPCSVEAQPFFNQIAGLYRGKASFVGILDAGIPIAQLYYRSNQSAYPILCETTPKTFRAFGAKQSVYTYLIARDGIIKRVWPGYSRSMLLDLNKSVAREARVSPGKLTLDGAPTALSSGCYFFEPAPSTRP